MPNRISRELSCILLHSAFVNWYLPDLIAWAPLLGASVCHLPHWKAISNTFLTIFHQQHSCCWICSQGVLFVSVSFLTRVHLSDSEHSPAGSDICTCVVSVGWVKQVSTQLLVLLQAMPGASNRPSELWYIVPQSMAKSFTKIPISGTLDSNITQLVMHMPYATTSSPS